MDQTRGSEVNGAPAEDPRILHFLSFPFRGGVEEHALSVLIALRNNGFAPFVAAPAPLLKIMEPELAAFGVRCAAIEISSPLDWRGAALLAAMLKRERIDLVHCHMATATLCALPAARMAGAMIIETCHGREFWRKGRRVKASFWVDRQASRFVDKYIAVSNAAAQHLRQVKGISEDKIVVILNGRDLTRLIPPTPEETAAARAELGLHNEPTVLLLGRLAEEKGHALLIEALKLLDSRWPSLIAIFAGTGPLEAEVRALCKAAGVTDRVRFLGYRQDLRPVLAAADMVVLPSVSEGLPLAAVEALAAARPIVATAVGGTPEVVLNDQTGLLIPPGNPAALAEAMDRVLSDRSLALRLGTSGRTFVERHFDVRTQVERTVALYRDLTMSPDSRAVVASDALTPH
jgi:glycosyltransferase involved in cell wall biosynthesis